MLGASQSITINGCATHASRRMDVPADSRMCRVITPTCRANGYRKESGRMRKAGRPRKHDDITAETVVDMYKNNEPIKEICRKTNVPASTLYHILARHGLSARRTPAHNHSDIGFALHDIHTEQELVMHYLLIDNERMTQMLLDMGVYTGTATSKAVPTRTHDASSVQADNKEGN